MRKKKNKAIMALLITVGLILIFGAAGLFIYNSWDNNRAEQSGFEITQAFESALDNNQVQSPAPGLLPDLGQLPDPGQSPDPAKQTESSIVIDGNSYLGIVRIPDLGLNLPVMDTWSYPNLKIAPCRYAGSIADNNMVIAAHDYIKFFGNISKLSVGDPIVFTDADGVDHNYTVAQITTLSPTAIEDMTNSGYALTLFTCTYSGQARVTVRCVNAA